MLGKSANQTKLVSEREFAFAEENYINKNKTAWEWEERDTKYLTKRTVTRVFLSSIWPAVDAGQHMKTQNFVGKSQRCQLWWASIIIQWELSRRSSFLFFQPSAKVLWVKPEPHIIQDIPTRSPDHSKSLEKKSSLNLDRCQETLISFYALASLRKSEAFFETDPTFLPLKNKKKSSPKHQKTQFHNVVRSDFKISHCCEMPFDAENKSKLPGASPASWQAEQNREPETFQALEKLEPQISQHDRQNITMISVQKTKL